MKKWASFMAFIVPVNVQNECEPYFLVSLRIDIKIMYFSIWAQIEYNLTTSKMPVYKLKLSRIIH